MEGNCVVLNINLFTNNLSKIVDLIDLFQMVLINFARELFLFGIILMTTLIVTESFGVNGAYGMHISEIHLGSKVKKVQVCGGQLTDLLSLLCNGRFQAAEKKSYPSKNSLT